MPELSSDAERELRSFLDARGRLLQYPAKRKKKLYALCYLAAHFAPDRVYTEAEVNELLEDWHCFHDPATLRRELFTLGFLDRTQDGREYRLASELPTVEQLERRYG